MNKRVLVLALALVVAFAGSAMAAVNFSGEFTAKISTEKGFKIKDGFKLGKEFSVEIGATASEKTDDLGWDFAGGVKFDNDEFEVSDYKLGLYDQHFKAWVWGGGAELSDKGTPFFITAGKKEDDIRARLEVPVIDVATVTLDFEPSDTLIALVDGEVEGYNVGLAYKLEDWSEDDKIAHTIAAHGSGAVADVNVKGEVAAKLGDDLGLAVGVGADTMLTDELKVEGTVKFKNEHWAEKTQTSVDVKATYTEVEYQAEAKITHTFVEGGKKPTIDLNAKYRFSDKLAYNQLLHDDHWFKNDAPAIDVSAKFDDLAFDNVTVKVASPVVEDIVWAKAEGVFKSSNDFSATVFGYVKASDKLVVKPKFGYKRADEAFEAELAAGYKIGLSGTTLNLNVTKEFKQDGEESISATVKVPF